MGARIAAREGGFAPLEIEGARLSPIEYTLPVPSAQVKSAVLLAGLFGDGVTSVIEPVRTRDHTELALGRIRRARGSRWPRDPHPRAAALAGTRTGSSGRSFFGRVFPGGGDGAPGIEHRHS